MPELPEVETVVRELRKQIITEKIKTIDTTFPRMLHGGIEVFQTNILNQEISSIERFGKYILICFENNNVMRIHLRMEGKFYITETKYTEGIDKHVHIVMKLSDGRYLKYHDVRKFGTFEIIAYQTNWHDDSKFNTLGYEPWDDACTAKFIYQRAQQSKTAIKPFLLSQKVIVGLGNIYVDEVLFRVKIHPLQVANTISKKQAEALREASIAVLKKAISLGGTTIRSYHSTLGIDGLFQNELQVHLQKGEPCPVCGSEIVKEKVSGRGSYYCPKCQKIK